MSKLHKGGDIYSGRWQSYEVSSTMIPPAWPWGLWDFSPAKIGFWALRKGRILR